MDLHIIVTVRKRMRNKSSEKLISIYKRRAGTYSNEAFEAIRQILVERRVEDASIDLTPPEGSENLVKQIEEQLARVPDFWGRTRTRLALFVLHIAVVVMAISLTPSEYAVELGASTGTVLILGTILLWLLLYFARSRKPLLGFCVLALAQAGFVAFEGLHFRSEQAVTRQIIAELPQQLNGWRMQLEQFRMDALFEALLGKRPLTDEELIRSQALARDGKAKAKEVRSNQERWLAEAEGRLAALSPRGARNFRRGWESQQAEADNTMKVLQDYFSEIERLTGFLIERRRRYRITGEGLVFDKDEDVQIYNERIETVGRLEEQLISARKRAEELGRQMPASR